MYEQFFVTTATPSCATSSEVTSRNVINVDDAQREHKRLLKKVTLVFV
jgi:hypothetical protein